MTRQDYTAQRGKFNYKAHKPNGELYEESSVETWAMQGFDDKPGRSRERKATGWLYPKSYQRIVGFSQTPKGVMEWTQPNGYRIRYDGVLQNMGVYDVYHSLPSWDYTMVTRAEIQALLRVKDQSVNLAQAWAERRMTADLVADTALKLAKAYRYARKGNFDRAAKALGARPNKAASNWLELQYGWLPLLSDVYGAAEALAKRDSPKHWTITGKGVVREPWTHRGTRWYGRWHGRTEARGMQGCFVRLDYIPGNDFFANLSNLGLTNPAQLAWELLPYSFVVDWIWPVGDWLSSLDATVGLEFLSGSRTQRREGYGLWYADPKPENGYQLHEVSYRASSKYLSLSRSVYLTSPIPFPPPPKNPFSFTRMANALALLAQAFR